MANLTEDIRSDLTKIFSEREEEVKEGLGDEAHLAEQDHEVQMARADLYKLAKYAIKLHEMLKGISERDGLEGWVQSKITKSADMIGSVYHHLEYQESPMGEVTEEVVTEEEDDNNDLIALLYAYEHGVDDGFFDGNDKNPFSTNEQRHAYRRGYDHGVWMYTENTHPDENV